MTESKPNTIAHRLNLSQSNADFLQDMKQLNCDSSSIVNLALDLLKPKLNNHGGTFETIREAAKTNKHFKLKEESDYSF